MKFLLVVLVIAAFAIGYVGSAIKSDADRIDARMNALIGMPR